VKVHDGTAFVPVASTTTPSAVFPLCGTVTTDWNDVGGAVECSTFNVKDTEWSGRTLRLKATGRVSRSGLTGHVGLYDLNLPSGPPTLITQFNFTDTADGYNDGLVGATPSSGYWQIKISLSGSTGSPDSFTLGSAALIAA
jgi:hypothetical protein